MKYTKIMQLTINPKDINVIQKLTITKPKQDKKTKRLISAILYNGNPAYFETPEIRAPFGLSKYEKGTSGTYDYSLPLKAVGGPGESQELVENFFQQLAEIDNYMINYGVTYSKEIFGKVYNEQQKGIVEALFSRGVKTGQDNDGNNYPPKISPKIAKAYESERPDLLIFRQSATPVDLDDWDKLGEVLVAGLPVRAIIQPKAWFIAGKFGITYRILQLKLPDEKKALGRPTSYAFSVAPTETDGPSESSEDKNISDVKESIELKKENTEYVENSDVEEEEEEEEEEDDEEEEVVQT